MKNGLFFISVLLLSVSSLIAQTTSYGDYTLYSKMGAKTTYLLDKNGDVFKSWTSSIATGYSSYMLSGGTILRGCQYSGNATTFKSGAAMCGMIEKMAYDGTVLWQYPYSSASYCTHHDLCPMPNGNVLVIAYELHTAAEAQAIGWKGTTTIWCDKIVELKQTGLNTGEVVWEWRSWDHLVQNYNSAKSNYVNSLAENAGSIDVNATTSSDFLHANGIDYNAELDQIVFSSHNLSEIFVIDHSTTTAQAATHAGGNSGKGGDILYRWGHPSNYGTSGTQILNVVHDAHWIPKGCPRAGYLVGFNNNGVSSKQSSIDMFNPPYNAYIYNKTAGSQYTPTTYTKRHACFGSTTKTVGYSGNQSNSQQLPNGNMLVCIASSGFIYEIDSLENILWSYTAGGTVPKAHRYTYNYIFGAKTATQTISLKQGWNIISTNVYPTDSSISSIFANIPVQTIKTMDTFWRSGQSTEFNGFSTITAGKGYLVYLTADATLSISGIVAEKNVSMPTGTNWQLIGYASQSSKTLSSVYTSSNCSVVKNFDGFWIPDGTTNSITTLNPNSGYFIKGK